MNSRVAVPIFLTPLSGESAHYELGLHYAAEMMKDRWDWRWVLLGDGDGDALAASVLEVAPDAVILPVHRTRITQGMDLIRALGAARPGLPVIWCGWSAHPPFLDAATSYSGLRVGHPSFVLACGEVEAVLPAVLERMEAAGPDVSHLEGLGGIAIPDRESGGWRGSQSYQFVEDVASLPSLPRSWFETIPKQNKGESGACWIDVSRGCRYKCSFCVASAFDRGRLRSFPPERIAANIRLAVSAGMKVLGLLTASMTYNIETLRSVVRALDEAGDASVAVASPVDARVVDDETLDLLSSINWANMTIGLQTTNHQAQRTLGRKDDPEQFARAIERISQFTTPEVELILGLPDDSVQGFKKTVEFAVSLPVKVSALRLRLDPWTRILMDRDKLGITADFTRLGRVVETASFSRDDFAECESWLRGVGRGLKRRSARALALDGEQLG